MKIATTRFGVVEIDDSSVIRMVNGPIGFEAYKNYCLIQHRPDTSFRWLQSVDEPTLAFVVVDPSQLFEDYTIELTDADAEALRLECAEDALVLTVVTIGEGGKEITVNLAAPIVINAKELIGMQVVLQDGRYPVRQPLTPVGQKETEPGKDQTALATEAA
ncbi:MAG: flagellar assembly protein FliW [Armatimonadota bacterium]|nr:flagellar assembly protein FliW [Armatimonadota bacterium]